MEPSWAATLVIQAWPSVSPQITRHSPGENAPTGIAEGEGRPVAKTWDRVLDCKACGMEVHWVQGISMADAPHWGHRHPAPHGEPVV